MNLFEGGGVPLASARVALRATGSLSAAAQPMPFSLTSTGRSPRGLPLPPLRWDESLVLMKRMADIDTETRYWIQDRFFFYFIQDPECHLLSALQKPAQPLP